MDVEEDVEVGFAEESQNGAVGSYGEEERLETPSAIKIG